MFSKEVQNDGPTPAKKQKLLASPLDNLISVNTKEQVLQKQKVRAILNKSLINFINILKIHILATTSTILLCHI